MQSYQFFDIHTHNPSHRSDVLEIVNIRLQHCIDCNEKWYSAGVHPYDVSANLDFSVMESVCFASRKLVAVGETGLDFRFQDSIALQRKFFERHIEISKRLQLPLIVHSVRALPETLSVLQRCEAERFVFHGFASDVNRASRVFSAGGAVSIGSLMLQNPNSQRFVTDIFDCVDALILLETDDGPSSIEEMYLKVSEILNVRIEELKLIIQRNFTTLYGNRIELFSE